MFPPAPRPSRVMTLSRMDGYRRPGFPVRSKAKGPAWGCGALLPSLTKGRGRRADTARSNVHRPPTGVQRSTDRQTRKAPRGLSNGAGLGERGLSADLIRNAARAVTLGQGRLREGFRRSPEMMGLQDHDRCTSVLSRLTRAELPVSSGSPT